MRLDVFLLADHIAIAEGKIYVNGGGITRINLPGVPFAVPSLALLVRYVLETPDDSGEHTMSFRMYSPTGANLLPDEAAYSATVEPIAELGGEEHALQAHLALAGIPFFEEGVHRIATYLDGDLRAEMSVPVVVAQSVS